MIEIFKEWILPICATIILILIIIEFIKEWFK